jgi:CheY-like chemotaxis protein
MNILILDDDETRHEGFKKILKGHTLTHVYTDTQAIKALEKKKFGMVCLDPDLGDLDKDGLYPGTGMNVAIFIAFQLERKLYPDKVLIHSHNTIAARQMEIVLEDNTNIPVIVKEFSMPKDL